MIFENRPSAGNGGTTDAQALTAALVVVQNNLENALEIEGLGANHAKLLRVDIPDTWEKPRECSVGEITAFADAGDGMVTVTSNGHPLQNGDLVTITNTTDYDGEFVVSGVAVNTFEIEATWGVTRTGDWSFTAEYYAPESYYKQLDPGRYVSRFYFGAVADNDVLGPPVDELLGVYYQLVDATDTPVILSTPCRGRYLKSAAEIVSIDEIDGDVTVNITVTTSTLSISNAWIDVLKAGN